MQEVIDAVTPPPPDVFEAIADELGGIVRDAVTRRAWRNECPTTPDSKSWGLDQWACTIVRPSGIRTAGFYRRWKSRFYQVIEGGSLVELENSDHDKVVVGGTVIASRKGGFGDPFGVAYHDREVVLAAAQDEELRAPLAPLAFIARHCVPSCEISDSLLAGVHHLVDHSFEGWSEKSQAVSTRVSELGEELEAAAAADPEGWKATLAAWREAGVEYNVCFLGDLRDDNPAYR